MFKYSSLLIRAIALTEIPSQGQTIKNAIYSSLNLDSNEVK
ncbi:hypothetical protein FLA105534_01391 [Flavobacterium bizetiae]|uniref:Uncharacterized protein n=1 Tax=Flavobacterium bizetiae TaxID=2704140 RepID=A0A6J4GG37_9FLAO|nr:hypothetical protein FLA105534_01391 [Flavobacterium bizetiae]CAD5342534.1 hypothetical protein FLA105535_02522 [Flavobacterium bizetiae]CAD5348069.1 hypothetical protein FLA105534_02028 [Flavobacterium bizetiae]